MSEFKSPLTPAEMDELDELLSIRDALPHLYGFPWYRWAKDFYDCENKWTFLCAANQISKSSTQIRKIIDWATDTDKWKSRWPNLLPGQKPNQFWLFYPTAEVWQNEFETKWEPDFLPRGRGRVDPTFGWKPVFDKGFIKKIEFNSGVTIYCRSYSQKARDIQSGSCHYVGLDEETPTELLPEIQARLRATNGYLSAVMTPTIGQEFWRRVFEPSNKEEELFPGAWKKQVSLYDSQEYIDGSKSRWTSERIKEVIAECATDNEVQRRVFGRFVRSEGLRYESFSLDRNMMTAQAVPRAWHIFGAVDPGSGGKQGHPAAFGFIAVRPDYKEGWVFRARRMDGIPTANPDILRAYRDLKADLLPISQVYDYKDKDFFLVAQSHGEPFSMANKARDEGFGLVNSLFKAGMLKIFRGDPELDKLVSELMSLGCNDDKRKAKDDLCDFVRYCSMSIPWDFSSLYDRPDGAGFQDPPPDPRSPEKIAADALLQDRRDFVLNKKGGVDDYNDEIEYWNELSGAGNE